MMMMMRVDDEDDGDDDDEDGWMDRRTAGWIDGLEDWMDAWMMMMYDDG